MMLSVKGIAVFLLALFSLGSSTTLHLAISRNAGNASDLVNASCPTWMHWSISQKKCLCGVVYANSVVFCSSRAMQVGALHGYCLTHSKLNNQSFIVGSCQYNMMKYLTASFYLFLPLNPSQLDHAMCGDFKRTGQLCGDCIEDHSPPVYTYHPQCVNCTKHTSNWGQYVAVSLVPQTMFFVGVLALRFRATSPHISGFILYSQLITPPPILRSAATISYNFRNDPFYADRVGSKIANALFTFHSIWNMDFFRLNYEPFCLNSHTSTLQILALDYIIAAYPLLLIVVIYTLVKLYYQHWRPLVYIWRPFQKCSTWFFRQWNIQASLVGAFATFLLLSYIKFLSVSFTLLFPAVTLNTEGSIHTPTYLYYASTTEYLGKEHLPYALLAIVNLIIFTLLPILLLCLYPCRSFHRCLNRYNLSLQALHIFMDTFQGSYKDGTNGTKDYRYFAAGDFVLRVAVYVSLIGQMLFLKYWITFMVMLAFLGAFTICRPFKHDRHNKLHIMWLLLLTLFYAITMPFMQQHIQVDNIIGSIMCLITASVPPLCIIYISIRSVPSCFNGCKRCCRVLTTRYRSQRVQLMQEPGLEEPCVTPLLNEHKDTYYSIMATQD